MGNLQSNSIRMLLLACIVVVEGSLFAQVPTVIIREGEQLADDKSELVTSLFNTAQNEALGYVFVVQTTGSVRHVWGDPVGGTGNVLRTEGTFGNLVQTSLETFIGFNDTGQISYSAVSNDTGSGETSLDGMWVDDLVILNEGDPAPGIPGHFSTFNSRPGIDMLGQPYWLGGTSTTTATELRVLYFGTNPAPLLRGGDSVPGIAAPIEDEGLDFDFKISALGTNFIIPVTLNSDFATDNLMVLNGEAMMVGGDFLREGTTVPASIGGTAGETWSSFDFLGITESGSYLVTGDTSGNIAIDEFVLIDEEFVLREGDQIDGLTIAGSIESAAYTEAGDWAVIWDVNDSGSNVEALIVNGALILKEGDLVDWNGDGVIDSMDEGATLDEFTGIDSMSLSAPASNGDIFVCFAADCEVNGQDLAGGFRIAIPGDDGPTEVPADNLTVFRGVVNSGGLEETTMSDDARLSMLPGFTISSGEAPVWLIFDANLSTDAPAMLEAKYESQAGTPGLTATLEAWNWVAGSYDVLDETAAPFNTDMIVVTELVVADHVEAGTNAVRSRLGWRRTGFTINFPWEVRIDHFVWLQQ